ncbi:MAG: CCA tRNA nucleotidyltransferase [Spirochaetota bacterium]
MISVLSIFRKKYPIILPADRHAMSRGSIDPEVLEILARIRRGGFQAYLVGGCVRDLLLGRKPKDFDIATDARPRQVKQLFRRCFLIGRRFRLAHVYISRDRFVEVATFRAAVDPEEVQGGRYAANNVFGAIEEDAQRRDFTVNSLYFNSADSSVVDYTGGLRDLEKKLLRSIGDPETRFVEDPVRIIRAARFCAQLDFQPSGPDLKAARSCAHHIKEANDQRLREELFKILRCGASAGTMRNLIRFGLLQEWLPELAAGRYHEGLFSRLAVVDRRRAKGEELPVSVLVTALLYDLFAEATGTSGGRQSFQESYILLKERFGEMAAKMRLPRQEWDNICNTAARQIILMQPGGGRNWKKFEKKFAGNAYFPHAMLFFEILVEATGRHGEQLAYWRRFASPAGEPVGVRPVAPARGGSDRQPPLKPLAECADPTEIPKPKKRRRPRRPRKRNPQQQPPIGGPAT